jgi:hypothetical protein
MDCHPLFRRFFRLLLLAAVFVLSAAMPAAAQEEHSKSSLSGPGTAGAGPDVAAATPLPAQDQVDPQVPGLLSRWTDGFNVGFTFSGLHDAQTGYSTLFTTAAGYNFNDTFSSDVSFPVYLYRLAPSLAANPPPSKQLVTQRGEPGDLTIGLHAQWSNKIFDYLGTFAFTVPTGDVPYGLSTGRFTLDLTNHFEHAIGIFTPDLEIGIGDSSSLVNRTVTKDYTSLGPLAHFQLGTSIDLIWGSSFSADAYEQMPIGDQKIYQSIRRGRIIVSEVAGANVTEDNGFINSLDIPLDRHTTLTGYYSRSLRLHNDTAAASITYTFRAPAPDTLESNVSALFR